MDHEDKVEQVLELISKVFPDKSETIATVSFVHWHNLVNHAALEELDSKQLLYAANLILAIASANFDNNSENTLQVSDHLKQVSFDEALDFLSEGAPPAEDKDV